MTIIHHDSRLKPCPFCGGEAVIRERKTLGPECKTCHFYGFASTYEQAIARWNRRTPKPKK